VVSRTIQDFEECDELKLIAQPGSAPILLTSVHVGAIGIERIGDATVNTVGLGANPPFVAPGRNDAAGIVGGGRIEWCTREGVSILGSDEAIGVSDQSIVWAVRTIEIDDRRGRSATRAHARSCPLASPCPVCDCTKSTNDHSSRPTGSH
jgi:hypothetical protein